MSYYIVTPKNEAWSNWQELAEKARIVIPKEQQLLGEELLLRNAPPKPEQRLLRLNDRFSPSYPAEHPKGTFSYMVAPHPIVILSLLASLEKAQVKWWTYRELVSSHLLADNKGKTYYFYYRRNLEETNKSTITFRPAEQDVYRCMYAWEYEKGAPMRYNEDKMACRFNPE